jgi:hypothetical protein
MYIDLDDRSRDVGRYADFVCVHIRIVRVHDSSTDDVPDAAGNQGEWQQQEQQAAYPWPSCRLPRCSALRGRRSLPFLLREISGGLAQERLLHDPFGFVE